MPLDKEMWRTIRTPTPSMARTVAGSSCVCEEHEAWWAVLRWPEAVRRRVEDRMRDAAGGLSTTHPPLREEPEISRVLRNRLADEEALAQIFAFEELLEDAGNDPEPVAVALEQLELWDHERRFLGEEWELLKHDPTDPLSRALRAFLPVGPGCAGADAKDDHEGGAPREGEAHRRDHTVLLVPAATLIISIYVVAFFVFGVTP